ncbi:MAG: TonB-dependent receptor [Ferruginibacter sp.]|nr:TonB-dependent receptor [Ferruginibacter sp.]
MKLNFTLLFLFFIATNFCYAQKTTTLTVSVKNQKQDTAISATVQLLSWPDSVLANTLITSKNKAQFTVSQLSKYLIKVSSVGYSDVERTINITDKPISTSIFLNNNTKSLQTVVVQSKKPLIKQEDDKTIVDATVLANSSTNAYEVLEKTPGAIVDQDGNVYLSSMTPATVFINGREMKLSSADIASLLKSLPAGSVSKVEILRNPSAKYDAASSGGIVNIVLKKGVKLGSSGSANIGYFQGKYSTQTAGVNINKSAGKVNSYFSYQFTKRNNFEELNTDRKIGFDTSLVSQRAYTTYPSINNYFGGGIDIAFTKKFNIGYDLRISQNNGKSHASNASDIIKTTTQALTGDNLSLINNKNNSLFLGNSISSKYKIDSLGSEWTTELSYNYYKNNNNQDYINNSYLPIKPPTLGDGKNENNKNVFTAQTDLVYKIPKVFNIEAGVKTTISNSRNGANYFIDSASTGRKVDNYQTNTFKYNETINAAYLQLSKTFWGFTLKPGLRLETTNISGRQIIPYDTSLSIKRTDLFPYVFLRHNLFKLFGMQLVGNAIYRRSIRRPYYEVLNPFPKFVDQYLFDVGNPNLKPQFTTNYEFNIMFEDFPVFAVGVNETKDIFTNVTYQDDARKIAFRTYDNLGKNKEFYFRAVGGIPPGGKYFFYMGVQHNLNEYNGFYANQPLNYKRGSWVFFMYQEYKPNNGLTLNLQGFMRTKGLQNFYELDNFGGLYISANKSILNKKGNLILSINDVFRTNQQRFALNQANVSASGNRLNDTRRVGLTFRYNFGLSKPKENSEFGGNVENKVN